MHYIVSLKVFEVILELYCIMGVSYFMYKRWFEIGWLKRAALGLVTSMHQSVLCCRDEFGINMYCNDIVLYNEVGFGLIIII